MIISGTFSVAAFIAGSLGKIMRLRIDDFLFFLAFVSIVFFFLPAMFLVRVKDTPSTRDKLILTSGTIAGVLYFFCMLLTFLGPKWPPFLGTAWANEDAIWLGLWLTSLGIALFVFLPAYFFKGISLPETRMNTVILSIFLVGFIGVQFRLTNLHPQKPRNLPVSMQENEAPGNRPQRINAVNKTFFASRISN